MNAHNRRIYACFVADTFMLHAQKRPMFMAISISTLNKVHGIQCRLFYRSHRTAEFSTDRYDEYLNQRII